MPMRTTTYYSSFTLIYQLFSWLRNWSLFSQTRQKENFLRMIYKDTTRSVKVYSYFTKNGVTRNVYFSLYILATIEIAINISSRIVLSFITIYNSH